MLNLVVVVQLLPLVQERGGFGHKDYSHLDNVHNFGVLRQHQLELPHPPSADFDCTDGIRLDNAIGFA
jgi:hypothetical protein